MNPITPISSSAITPTQQVDAPKVSTFASTHQSIFSTSTNPMTAAATTTYLFLAEQTSGFSPLMQAYDAAYEEWNGQLASQYILRQPVVEQNKIIWNEIHEPEEIKKIQDEDNPEQDSQDQDDESSQQDLE